MSVSVNSISIGITILGKLGLGLVPVAIVRPGGWGIVNLKGGTECSDWTEFQIHIKDFSKPHYGRAFSNSPLVTHRPRLGIDIPL